ncbi:lycopene cyclase domain-containing protein [Cryobacterium tepidiphilum]|uniref:Lycopene cyclase domain-containing protein n=1 Tax=Cryobacterium tepidiphilum TaxID=2486026 RepID=A0A3M8LPL4_9MICO|nr:lycopene cyclase domain-containing protein [Cryobacterium tepidiphilum]RNE67285.1 lycopene cyclase domain-containing protein [Cryobacterium tepidiphilum]
MSVAYLACLLVALGCMALLDRRFRLFFWKDAGRATLVLAGGLIFFLAWDLLGIAFGIFARGETRIMTGMELAPELPLEEPVFLAFLCYLTVVLISGIGQMASGRRRDGR